MDGNELRDEKELPPFHHGADDVAAACGVNMDREGGIKDVGDTLMEKCVNMSRDGEGVHTSHVIEAVETSNLNIREKIMLALLLGKAKGVQEAPHILMSMLKEIKELKGGDDFDGFTI